MQQQDYSSKAISPGKTTKTSYQNCFKQSISSELFINNKFEQPILSSLGLKSNDIRNDIDDF